VRHIFVSGDRQAQASGTKNGQQGFKRRVPIWRQCPVQTFTLHAGTLGNSGHALGFRHLPQCHQQSLTASWFAYPLRTGGQVFIGKGGVFSQQFDYYLIVRP
jgi:hypothetical protein